MEATNNTLKHFDILPLKNPKKQALGLDAGL